MFSFLFLTINILLSIKNSLPLQVERKPLAKMQFYLLKFFLCYVITAAIFVVQKVVFMLVYWNLYAGLPATDILSVVAHGLPMDLSVAGYITIIPALLIIASAWSHGKAMAKVEKGYYVLISALLSAILFLMPACMDIGDSNLMLRRCSIFSHRLRR